MLDESATGSPRDSTTARTLTMPDVTFVVAAKNMRLYVAESVESALAQVGVAVEVLVVDDASSDETVEVVSAIAARDPRVRILRNDKSLGPGGARNRALDEACGDWIAILDADDIVEPQRAATLLALAAEHNCEIVADNVVRFSSDDPTRTWPLLSRSQVDGVRKISIIDFLRMNCMTHGDANLGFLKPVFSRAFLSRYRIRYDEQLPIGEDFDFCLRCISEGARYLVTSDTFYRYRIRPESASRQLKRSDIRSLIAAHRRVEPRAGLNPPTRRAHAAYERSLEDALVYVDFREACRTRQLAKVAVLAIRPRLWRAVFDMSIGLVKRKYMIKQTERERLRSV